MNDKWFDYYKYRKMFLITIICFIPASILSEYLSKINAILGPIFYLFIYGSMLIYFGYRYVFFRCPKCGKPIHFIKKYFFSFPFSWKCLNCGMN